MKKKDILKDAKEILEMLPNVSKNGMYSFIFEINNTIKRVTNNMYIYPYLTLLIKEEDKIIKYVSANSGERDYDKRVDEIKNEIIGYKTLNKTIK